MRHVLSARPILALAVTAALASPQASAIEVSSDSAPPNGRSLFDFLTAKKVDDKWVYDVPFPFDTLVTELARRNHNLENASNSMGFPSMVLIPNGRSLQKESTNVTQPRAVIGFTDHPNRSHDAGLLMRDRLYVGFAEKSHQLEVISYNEIDGRFEFQIVSDYREGGAKKVLYANRAFCTECHKAETPLFAKNTWDETNANPGVSTALAKNNDEAQTFFNIIKTKGSRGTSYAIDTSTDRAAKLPHLMRLWRKGCKDPTLAGLPATFKPADCRAHVFLFGMASAVGVEPHELAQSAGGYTFQSYDKILEIWKKNLKEEDLKFAHGDIENRNPSGYDETQLTLIDQERDRIELWTKNLKNNTALDAKHDPKQTPVVPYAYLGDVDAYQQNLDMMIHTLSGFLTPSERKALPQTAAAFKEKVQGNFAALIQNAAQAGDAFGDKPLRKGAAVLALWKAAGVDKVDGKTPVSTCCDDVSQVPPVAFDSGGVVESSSLALMNKYCYASCHGTLPGELGFLRRDPGMSDRELWIKIVKTERDEICNRLDWNQPTSVLSVTDRMPRGPKMQELKDAEANTGTSDRKGLIEGYKEKLLELAGEEASVAAIGVTADELRQYAEKCKWTRYQGQ